MILNSSLLTDWSNFEEGDYAVLKENGETVRACKCYRSSFRVNGYNGTITHLECEGFYKPDSDFFHDKEYMNYDN